MRVQAIASHPGKGQSKVFPTLVPFVKAVRSSISRGCNQGHTTRLSTLRQKTNLNVVLLADEVNNNRSDPM